MSATRDVIWEAISAAEDVNIMFRQEFPKDPDEAKTRTGEMLLKLGRLAASATSLKKLLPWVDEHCALCPRDGARYSDGRSVPPCPGRLR